MKNAFKVLPMILMVVLMASCKKEGIGGDATIEGHVMHHSVHIPNATVYIKYGEKEFPGSSTGAYDASTTASSGDGHFEFEELVAGDYYLYAVGYDSAISEAVFGGIPVTIKKNSTTEVMLPVVE